MRTNYISWDEYFMGIAILSSRRSKDPQTQVGACIVNRDKKIMGIGYNGFPIGIEDKEFPWESTGDYLDTKYAYVVHAEVNAVLNSTASLKDCTLYVTLFPCNECAKIIIQAGIKEVVYQEDKYADSELVLASKRMFEAAKIKFRQIDEKLDVELTRWNF
ncbi:MAG: dCMP deaminase family protein [Erysipelotrichales bacterium]|nr:dCMP deaminase family protein [Erysipelotrichales bacterium]